MPSNNNGAFAALGLATAALVGASLLGGDEQQPPAAPQAVVAAPHREQPQVEAERPVHEGRLRVMEAKRRQQEWATARRAQRAEKARRDAERGRPQ
jgi:hypothetical protein